MPTPLPDNAYSLPLFISNDPSCEHLVDLFNVIIQRMREESECVTMNTIQELLLERIATNYIILRWRERATTGEAAFSNSKDFNTFWLAMTREFLKQVNLTDAVFRDQLLQTVNGAVSQALAGLHDDVAKPLRERFAKAFEEAGL